MAGAAEKAVIQDANEAALKEFKDAPVDVMERAVREALAARQARVG